jgi:indole-3-glycerol phosphate synthase
VIGVSESGLKSREELERLSAAGYRAFLIGERFMTDPDPARAIGQLLGSDPIDASTQPVESGRRGV